QFQLTQWREREVPAESTGLELAWLDRTRLVGIVGGQEVVRDVTATTNGRRVPLHGTRLDPLVPRRARGVLVFDVLTERAARRRDVDAVHVGAAAFFQ